MCLYERASYNGSFLTVLYCVVSRFLILFAILLNFSSYAVAADQSRERIQKILIKQSIGSYSGNCACPYNTTANGSRCGKRSAYSRQGGAKPLCYPEDVSDKMIQNYRKANK